MDTEKSVHVLAGSLTLEGTLSVPAGSRGVVLFAHGSGSSRLSPRNRYVARLLNEGKLATLLVDLLTREEEAVDARTAHLRFDIGLLAERLAWATDWLAQHSETRRLPIGYFGASTGAAAALVAAVVHADTVGAIVSRGGRPDLVVPDARPAVPAGLEPARDVAAAAASRGAEGRRRRGARDRPVRGRGRDRRG